MPAAFLRWRMNELAAAEAIESRLFKPGDSVVLDFGTHLTGYFALSLRGEGAGYRRAGAAEIHIRRSAR